MRLSYGADAPAQIRRERGHPAGREIDVEKHQFLRRGALSAGEREHLVPEIEPLLVGAEDPGGDSHPRPNQQLAFVAIVGFGDEGAQLLVAAIVEAEPEFVEQHIGRLVEQHGVVGQVHVAVVVDPLGTHFAFKPLEWGR